MRTYHLLLDVVAPDTTVEKVQSLGCLIELSFTGEPPRRFREEDEDYSDKADHRPLEIRVSLARRINFKPQLASDSPVYR